MSCSLWISRQVLEQSRDQREPRVFSNELDSNVRCDGTKRPDFRHHDWVADTGSRSAEKAELTAAGTFDAAYAHVAELRELGAAAPRGRTAWLPCNRLLGRIEAAALRGNVR